MKYGFFCLDSAHATLKPNNTFCQLALMSLFLEATNPKIVTVIIQFLIGFMACIFPAIDI